MTPRQPQLSELLEIVARAIDIPQAMYEKAVGRYKEVGEWLCDETSALGRYSPDVYSQGSTRLGTNNRPITQKDEYDFDGVAELDIAKEKTTQKMLKNLIGDRLKENPEYEPILEEGRRCWTLTFNGTFHMDILPAIPNREGKLKSILITDKELREWQFSNPRGYADWFKRRMVTEYASVREPIEQALKATVEEVPAWRIKTPLQKCVQLVKRHRDVYFQDDPKNKPVSIVITTLAGRAYQGHTDLFEAVGKVIPNMRRFIGKKEDGKYVISNPVEEEENFADKWTEHPERERNFFAWLYKLEYDFAQLCEADGLENIGSLFADMFGVPASEQAMKTYGVQLREQRERGLLKMAGGTGLLGKRL